VGGGVIIIIIIIDQTRARKIKRGMRPARPFVSS
jgi:hypothetical protein